MIRGRRIRALVALLLCGLAAPAGAQRLVTDVSREIVELRYDFAGTELLLFGAIKHPPRAGERIDLVATVTGPPATATVRRKARVGGVWINADAARIADAPGYFALATTQPLEAIAGETTLSEAGLGLAELPLSLEGPFEPGELAAFRAGYLRRMQASGLYRVYEGGMRLMEQTLFRTTVTLPANVPVGRFSARVSLFVDGRLVDERRLGIAVDKTGFERTIFAFAHEQPFFYGLSAVAIALLAGWAAGLAARR